MTDVNTNTVPAKVSINDIMGKIKRTEYVLLPDGRTTICQLTLENGYTVQGQSACVVLAEYNRAMGEQYAFEDAIKNIWPLEGYLLAQRRFEAGLV